MVGKYKAPLVDLMGAKASDHSNSWTVVGFPPRHSAMPLSTRV